MISHARQLPPAPIPGGDHQSLPVSHPLTERSPLAGECESSRRNDGGCWVPTALQSGVVAAGSALEPFGYGAEEPPAFCPRTHAAMIFQSGSSWDVNCLPPWWVSARPPTSGASGISSNRLVSGLPGVTGDVPIAVEI